MAGFPPLNISDGDGQTHINASLEIPKLLDKATAALRSKRHEEAASCLEQVITLTENLPPGDLQRIEGLSRTGRLYLSLRQLDPAQIYLHKAAEEIDLHKVESSPSHILQIY